MGLPLSEFAFAIAFLVVFIVFKHILRFSCVLWTHFKCVYLVSNASFIRSLGKWAVVTGGTDGIGLEYAHQLARLGLNLILVARSEEKLKETATALAKKHSVSVEYIVADFTKVDIYPYISSEISRLTQGNREAVGVLVNNVGMTQDHPDEFYRYHGGIEFFQRLVTCNITSAVIMSRIFLGFLRQEQRGLIINIASASSINPIPLSAMYSSSKRCFAFFSRGLCAELQQAGNRVQVHTVLPFFVLTKFLGSFRPSSILAPNADTYVETTFKKAGFVRETYGTLSHELQGWITETAPTWLHRVVAARIHAKRRAVLVEDLEKKKKL